MRIACNHYPQTWPEDVFLPESEISKYLERKGSTQGTVKECNTQFFLIYFTEINTEKGEEQYQEHMENTSAIEWT